MEEQEKPKRGRKKKVAENLTQVNGVAQERVELFDDNVKTSIKESPFSRRIRGLDGLIKGVEYHFDEHGFVDWRKMVNKKHIVLNRMSVAKAGKDIYLLTDDEKTKLLEEWPDEKKVIRLAGFKEVARLRGLEQVDNHVVKCEDGSVICHCTIRFIPNFESDGLVYTAVASAAPSNVGPEYSQFLEAIASNRAFCRAVREALNIHVVSDEEFNPNEKVEIATATNLNAVFQKTCEERKVSFETVLKGLAGGGLENPNWIDWASLPKNVVLSAIDLLKLNSLS